MHDCDRAYTEGFDAGVRLQQRTTRTNQAMVREFHQRYGLVERAAPVQVLPADERELRDRLFDEETAEYREAYTTRHRAKEAADVLYILYGDALHCGYDLDAVFAEVHRSNMTKDGGQRADGKILKGPGYEPPNLAPLTVEGGPPHA